MTHFHDFLQVESSTVEIGSSQKPIDKLEQKPNVNSHAQSAIDGKLKPGREGNKPAEGGAAAAKPSIAEDRRKGIPLRDQPEARPGKRERAGKPYQAQRSSESGSRDSLGRKAVAGDKPPARQSQVKHIPTILAMENPS